MASEKNNRDHLGIQLSIGQSTDDHHEQCKASDIAIFTGLVIPFKKTTF